MFVACEIKNRIRMSNVNKEKRESLLQFIFVGGICATVYSQC
jgi:hypothetical protein